MATFHDSALGSASASSVGPLATTDALAVTAGDLIVASAKWETGTTTVTFDSGASTPLFTVANAVRQEASGLSICGAVYFWIATATGTINPRFTLGVARDFREIRAVSITPAAGKTFVLGNVNAADGPSLATAISAGTASATGSGVGVTAIALNGSRTITPGTNWLEPAEFNTSISAHEQYQLISGSGTITGDCTLSSAVEFVIQLALFTEVSTGGSRPPLSQITLNPGGIPTGPSSLALGKAPNYGAVRWQEWEKYPWSAAAAASTTNLDISTPGSITLAGQSMTMGVGVALSTQGSITLAGQSVTMGLGVAPGAGAITIAGQSVTSSLGLALSTQGSISINGQAIALAQGTALAIDTSGSITLAGQSVAMNLGIAPSAGSITIAGQSVTLALSGSQDLAIDVPGSISLLGQDVALFNSTPVDVGIGGGGGGGLGGKWEERSTALRTVRRKRRREIEVPTEVVTFTQPPIVEPVYIEPIDVARLAESMLTAPVADWADRLLSDQRLRQSIGDDARKLADVEREEQEAILALMILLDEDET